MPDLEDVVYSREETIAAVDDYYTFLTRMYMNEDHIIRPPEQGWPSIVNADRAALKTLGKSVEVLELLAHLPYVHMLYNWYLEADAAPQSLFADWNHDIGNLCDPTSNTTAEKLRAITEGEAFKDLAPPHVVGLRIVDYDEPAMVLDTRLGIVLYEDCPNEICQEFGAEALNLEPDSDDDDNDMSQEEIDWRCDAYAWPVQDFFRVLKAQYLQLHWIPISSYTVVSAERGGCPDGMVSMLRDIYKEHGWPDLDAYRKSDCLEAIRKAMQEHYPKQACIRG